MPVRNSAAVALLLGATLALAACKIVPIPDETAEAASKTDALATRADTLWRDQATGWFASAAQPIGEVLPAIKTDLAAAGEKYGRRQAAEGAPWTFVVKGAGTIAAKNTESRAGTLVVALDGTSPPGEVTLQIGPVIRGNGVRDSLPFVSFKDFENQIDYADMGKALNTLALKGIEAPVAAAAAGQRIAFTGVISLSSPSDKLLVTPVEITAAQP